MEPDSRNKLGWVKDLNEVITRASNSPCALKTRTPNCVRSEKAAMRMSVKFEGISEELQKIIDANMDKVEARRLARDAFKDIQLSIDHCLFKMPHAGLKMKEFYEIWWHSHMRLILED
ncbi:hypothetical protein H5410_006422 [Solanum commersonii]|uniref:Uncharacterized protein n=1 Tax=Solanum commersonii TaxID=4109 RepID=A0A9J6AA75_SOLCO|nr:hypothetical protein H5410_006422 [Solanum commersonii]